MCTENAIKIAFAKSHDEFIKNNPYSGSTAIVALVIKDHLWVVNLGDSRAVLSNAGTAIQLSRDHCPTDKKISSAVYNRGGVVKQGIIPRIVRRENLSSTGLAPGRAFGDRLYRGVNPRPTIKKYPLSELKSGSVLILACDGVWDVLGSEEVVDLIKDCSKEGTEKKSYKIIMEAINKWSEDNLTVISIKLFD